MTIGKRISNLRKDKGLSQENLAEMIGVSRQAVSKWENDITAPDTYNLIELAKFFEVTVEYIALGSKGNDAADIGQAERQNENQAKAGEKSQIRENNKKSKSFTSMILGFFLFGLGIVAFALCTLFILSDVPITIPNLITVFIPILSVPIAFLVIGWNMMF